MGKIKKVSLTVYVREDEADVVEMDLSSFFFDHEALLWGGRVESVDMDPAHPNADAITTFLHQFDEETEDA